LGFAVFVATFGDLDVGLRRSGMVRMLPAAHRSALASLAPGLMPVDERPENEMRAGHSDDAGVVLGQASSSEADERSVLGPSTSPDGQASPSGPACGRSTLVGLEP
jgi:hypothetical protein